MPKQDVLEDLYETKFYICGWPSATGCRFFNLNASESCDISIRADVFCGHFFELSCLPLQLLIHGIVANRSRRIWCTFWCEFSNTPVDLLLGSEPTKIEDSSNRLVAHFAFVCFICCTVDKNMGEAGMLTGWSHVCSCIQSFPTDFSWKPIRFRKKSVEQLHLNVWISKPPTPSQSML